MADENQAAPNPDEVKDRLAKLQQQRDDLDKEIAETKKQLPPDQQKPPGSCAARSFAR